MTAALKFFVISRKQGGFPLIGVPKTIDNDLAMTETSIGFDTAVAVATEALDRLQPTAASHDRIMILEVMGRDAGHIALTAGIAGGADVILIPEIPYDIRECCQSPLKVFLAKKAAILRWSLSRKLCLPMKVRR